MTNPDQPETNSRDGITDDQLMQVYLSGMISGVASMLAQGGMPHQIAEVVGRNMAETITGDPAAYQELSDQVASWVDNPDGPKASIVVEAYVGPKR
ncbi:hypothetical protein J1766_gp81 [Gordonia phage Bizzy]|uniref:Uncharacterized protein n=3 Tax=Kroosvirus TaxID=2948789 RepID=A0A3G3M8E0_9CAUD|nr:hypothetical protein J1766_gp81 [Gordonia phage Bizzy]YP_010002130.1 hypothetical protein J1767_gp81 [Gordonia phage Tangerine]YP_010002214.1 hypothetical protein J1768_gp80 [Gordonia phage Ribeye]AXH44943.1 hypothetical protein SEA_RIBEYE_80 [Gordonia phage Ribeye]AYR02716.1 hypothetical protein SEA_BIZZY_81 [Gordonia phage Bizzy]QDM57380.1 hypothetical protein SEA_TANGERINE_81 [Gordonia phage Tangerine]